jgi:hypothetical protein
MTKLVDAVREYLNYYDPADCFDGDLAKQKLSEILAEEEQKLTCCECGNKPFYDGHQSGCSHASQTEERKP